MINGAHVLIQSKKPDADRAFFRDVLGLEHVDVGGGWLLFGLPPSELAVHPSSKNNVHEVYLMCEDVQAFIRAMAAKKLACSAVKDEGWGLVTMLSLPGGGKLGVYQPRHARPGIRAARPASKAKPAKKAAKKASKKQPTKNRAAKKAPARRAAK